MSQYKELADRLESLKYRACDEAAAILRSLDAQPVAWMHHQSSYKEPSLFQLDDDQLARGWTESPLYAAPVAAQPQQAKPISDSHPLMVFAQECAIGAYGYGGLRLAAQNAIKAAHGAKEQAKPLSDAEFAINMLEMMFTAYENGVPCYEDPEDEVGFIGYAVRLADDDFNNIGDFLNRVRPVQPSIKEQG